VFVFSSLLRTLRSGGLERSSKFHLNIIIIMKTSIILILALIAFAGCMGPGQMVSTGYLVTVEEGIQCKWDRVETSAQVDSFITRHTGLTLNTETLMGDRLPFFDFRNERFYVYAEKQGIYQRRANGKKRWRVYDEMNCSSGDLKSPDELHELTIEQVTGSHQLK
jgi:hypothetical protein